MKKEQIDPALVLALSALKISEESKGKIRLLFLKSIMDINLVIALAYGFQKKTAKDSDWNKEELEKNYELIWKAIYEEATSEDTMDYAVNASTEAFEEWKEKDKNDTSTSTSGNC